LNIIDTHSLTVTGQIDTAASNSVMLEISDDGLRLYTATSDPTSITAIDVISGKRIGRSYGSYGYPFELALSPDGSKLFYINWGGPIYVFDTPTLGVNELNLSDAQHSIPHPEGIGFSCDGRKTYITAYGDTQEEYSLVILDTDSLKVRNYFQMPDGNGDWQSDPATKAVVACPEYKLVGLALTPPVDENTGGRGDFVAYRLELINATGITNTFQLSAGPTAWETTVSKPVIGPLAPWAQEEFTVTVQVPVEASWYTTQTVQVNAVSLLGSNSYRATARLITKAYTLPQLRISPAAIQITQQVGESQAFPLTIQNGNAITLTYSLTTALNLHPAETGLLPAGRFYTTTEDNEDNFGSGEWDLDMDHYICPENKDAPIEFNIWVDGEVGPAGSQLGILTWDNQVGETNPVFLNGVKLGILAGGEGIWNESVFPLPEGLMHPGKNLVQIYPQVHGSVKSCIWIDWGRIFVSDPAAPWIRFGTGSGSLKENESQEVQVYLDTAGFPVGRYEAYLQVKNNHPTLPWVEVPIIVTVAPGSEPPPRKLYIPLIASQ
jgi:hypothetical protein